MTFQKRRSSLKMNVISATKGFPGDATSSLTKEFTVVKNRIRVTNAIKALHKAVVYQST